EVFRRALAEQGVQLRIRALASGTVPPTLKLLAHHDSAPLSDVLRLVNKHSDNYLAESILKTLGAETRTTPGPATWADGVAALRAQLAQLGIADGYRSENGSGLFASSEVSAKQLLVLLAAAHRDYRIGPDLVASLPVGGADGTLARRWVGKPAMGRVRAKTGTLDKVSTLAGYIGVDGGHLLAFAILVNDIPPVQRGAVRAMADEIVEAMAAYLGAT
ncbi:MAG TPA: D-alanyl-D-alanine carboxypeptidase/D-alanyl-D-alanine-endopeptidase, partial [Kofleriaceae bacterium]|nr:D-alanyl-D-alanine carboxypeptidase/D-alanyl-D-alanine-endopeptidase [Kofleriaceae bacterium]